MKGGLPSGWDQGLPHVLRLKKLFSRRDFVDAMSSYEWRCLRLPTICKNDWIVICWSVSDGGQYALPGKTVYSYEYSEEAVDVAQWIEKEFDGLDFRVFELVQLNDFINHQIAHNTILWQQKTTLLTSLLTACGKRIPEGLCWSLRQISITDIIRIMTWLLGDFLQNLQRAFAIRGKADWKKSWWMCLHVNYSPESTI